MTTYTLTVSTDALGLGVISGARVIAARKRTKVTDIFNGQDLSRNNAATNELGVATMLLEPDDGSVYHELKIFDLAGILVYSKIFIMPPQSVSITDLPIQDIISSSAAQAVAAAATATTKADLSTTNAEQTALDAISTAADALSCSASEEAAALSESNAESYKTAAQTAKTDAENARDAALIQAGVYATEAEGRAAVADGQAFKVQGSGDVAAYEYRRVDVSSSILIAQYPAVSSIYATDSSKRKAVIGKNRFDKNDENVVADFSINRLTGLIQASSGFSATGYIPVSPSTNYTMSVGRDYAWYDSSRVYISGGVGTGTVQTVTSPALAKYFRCGVADANFNNFQFEAGNSSTVFAEYTEEPILLDNVVTTSSILYSAVTPRKTSFITTGKNLFDVSSMLAGYFIVNTGAIAANASYDTSDYIKVTAGQSYKASHNMRFSCYFDSNMNVVAGGISADTTTFTAPVGASFVRISMLHSYAATFQLELGSIATSYEPFKFISTVPSLLENNSVTSDNIVQNSITAAKTNFIQVDKNKFNKNTATIGSYCSNTGAIAPNAFYDLSGYIPVTVGTQYVCNGSGIYFSCYFDENLNVVAGGTGTNITTFTVPAGVAYVRITIAHSGLNTFQLEIGSVATTYESYKYVLLDPDGVAIKAVLEDRQVITSKLDNLAVSSEKLANAAVLPDKTNFLQIGKNKFNKNAVTTGYYCSNTGAISANATYDLSDYIPVIAGTEYVCNGSGIRFSCYFDSNLNVVAGGSNANITTFTPPVGVAYVRVSMYHSDLSLFQLEIGSTPTTYQKYQYELGLPSVPIVADAASSTPVLVIPPYIYGVQSRECNVYLDNLHVGDSSLFNHDVTNTVVNGAQQRERWTWTPTGAQTTGTLTVSAHSKITGDALASVTTNQRAAASTAGTGLTKTINVIGDSLINAGVITQTVIDIASSDVMGVSFIGTRGTGANKHEGRGGWTIAYYTGVGITYYSFTVSGVVTAPAINSTLYTNNGSTFKVQEVSLTAGAGTIVCERTAGTNLPSASGTLTKSSGIGDAAISFSSYTTVAGNPFWISGALNYPQYLVNNSLATPDWVMIHLGINDAFSYTSDDAVIAGAATAFNNLDLLITSIKAAGAGVKVGLMIPTPPAKQDGFGFNYGTGQTAFRCKRNIMLWAKELITRYSGQEANRVYLVPSNTALDTENGYPLAASAPVNSRSSVMVQRQNNGVHPDIPGYQQIGDALWAFLKCNA